ncbi:nitroreductase family protein [Effusibacillus lacus]|uniref:Ferredoxin--nitrite reductase n=1 Tax=Effusibacillus lacus TaxID=1348429 RepID=A0A292YHD7_9BACL|nr:nitroreductase family protein [Effusibacillus lacus]TCS72279.1 nitroreductase [Effusibacillus lacus]GAX90247.1 ferredoxin--nitrite reductase [Effusibacillus lacus]
MDVLSAIEKRREITSFKPDSIPPELLDKLIRSAYLAPSGNNLPSREFILVTDRDKLQSLAATTPYMKWLEQSAAAVVIVSDQQLSKYWLQDASIAGGFLWLTAVSLGLGAAWGAVYHSEDPEESAKRERYAREQLGIPEHLRVVAILGLGWPAAEPSPKEMYPVERVVHTETYPAPSSKESRD